jgi:ABC-2 type transport system ATP-binding protein
LDEPTVGLDPNQILEIRELIREIGKVKTILLSTHILQEVSATCRRVIIINEGRIVAEGTPDALTAGSFEHSTYQITLRGETLHFHEELSKLPHYTESATVYSENDLHHILLKTSGQEDLSELIFDIAVKGGWSLARLAKDKVSLEDVFKKLTK